MEWTDGRGEIRVKLEEEWTVEIVRFLVPSNHFLNYKLFHFYKNCKWSFIDCKFNGTNIIKSWLLYFRFSDFLSWVMVA